MIRLAFVSAALLLATGCSTTLEDMPLPGTDVDGETVTLEADFTEALNLATGASVKVNGVDADLHRRPGLEVLHLDDLDPATVDAALREGATARLRYTTPLGELFVDVTNPTSGALLEDGDVLGLESTSTAPTVEDGLSQASLLVNGGGLGQLETVTRELNAALGGREGTFRDLLRQTQEFLTQANATTGDVDRALRGLAAVSVELRERQDVIDAALRDLRPAAVVLREQTPNLTALLRQVERFATSADRLVGRTRTQIIATLEEVSPVLDEILANKATYGRSLDALVALSKSLSDIVPGDYLATALDLHVDGLTQPDLGDVLDGILDDLGLRLREGMPRWGGAAR